MVVVVGGGGIDSVNVSSDTATQVSSVCMHVFSQLHVCLISLHVCLPLTAVLPDTISLSHYQHPDHPVYIVNGAGGDVEGSDPTWVAQVGESAVLGVLVGRWRVCSFVCIFTAVPPLA